MLDTKQSWDDLVLRHAPDEETAYRILENRLYHNLTARFVQSHDYIAMERLFEIHATRRVRPDHHRHAADPERDRLPRRARAHGRLLRRPAAALAHAAVPRRRQARRARASTSRAGPSTRWPTASSAASSSQDIAEFFLNFQSMYDGFVERAQCGRAAAARPAHDVRGRDHARGRAAARGRAVLRRAASTATSTSARSCSTRRCPTTCSIPTARRAASALHRRRRRRSPTRSRDAGDPALADPTRTARVLRTIGESFRELLGGRDARGRAARRARRACPTSSCACPTFERRHQRRRRARRDLPATSSTDGPRSSRPREHARRSRAGSAPRWAGADLVHIERLVASWRPLADLSFADLVLLAPIAGEEGHRFVVLAQVRPVTGQTNYPQDLVGTVVDEVERPLLRRAAGARARSSRPTRRARRRRSACACSASPCAATAG